MENRNKKLIPIIIILIGLYIVTRLFISVGNTYLLIFGVSLLFLYKFKKIDWALTPGLVFSFLGFIKMFNFGFDLGSQLQVIFFLAPGIVFNVLYYKNRKSHFLLFGNLLIGFSIFIILANILSVSSLGLFMLLTGISLFISYKIGKLYKIKFIKYYGLILTIIGLLLIIFIR